MPKWNNNDFETILILIGSSIIQFSFDGKYNVELLNEQLG